MLSFSPYLLAERREGALIRVEREGSFGYADLHPWPEFGDLPLSMQLKALARGNPSSLGLRALEVAALDREARREGKSLLKGLTIPQSHFLLTSVEERIIDRALEEGFSTFKLKMTPSSLRSLPSKGKWRLDMNSSFTREMFISFLDKIDTRQIEFVEDPYPAQESWEGVRIPLASDWEKGNSFSYQIVKPSRSRSFLPSKKIVVTSYLGHPFGQVADAYVAATLPKEIQALAGLQSHRIYPKNSFSERLASEGPHFTSCPGFGFGFGDLLEKLSWSPLS